MILFQKLQVFFKVSVDDVVSDFQTAIDKLEALNVIHAAQAEALKLEQEFHAFEASRAASIKAKIEALIK